LYMPVRRRSIIQTPGVATRSNSARDLPPLPQLNFRHSHPPTPSLSRQQSVESYRSGVVSMPPRALDPDSVPRVVTPCEDKYLSIGAFKLGSLRITNGSPRSLTPDVDRTRGKETLSPDLDFVKDGYFAKAQVTEPRVTAAPVAQGVVHSHNFLRNVSRSPSSPSGQSQPTSPALQTTSKATAVEDQLFDDEAQPEYSSIEVLDVRLDPNAKPPHARTEHDGSRVARTDSGFVSITSPGPEVSQRPLAKADSGYSSNVSLRSLQTKPHLADGQRPTAALEKQLSQSSSPRMAPVASEEENQAETMHSLMPETDSPPPPVPPKDSARYSQPSLSKGARNSGSTHRLADESRTNTARPMMHPLKPLVTAPSAHRGPASPESEIRSPVSVRSSASGKSVSASSTGGGAQKPGRLQRLLSGVRRPAPEPLVIQSSHAVVQDSIPPVPREAEHKLQEHAGRFPTTARRLALKSRASLDTLKTIFSVGSLEASFDAVNSLQTVPPTVPESEGKEGLWKQTLNSVPASIANVAAHVIPRKPITRKPVPLRRESLAERHQEAGNGHDDAARGVLSPTDADATSRLPESSRRTMSLTSLGEKVLKPRHRASELNLVRSTADLPSPALPSPVAKALSVDSDSEKRMSQPASATRRPLSLRVPPPLRPQSSAATLSRKASRESIQSYPAMHPLESKTSMDSLRSYSSSQPGAGVGSMHSRSNSGISMDPRRLQSFRQYQSPQSSPYNSPDWEVQTDNGIPHRASQTFTASGSRRNSISSVQSEGGYHRTTPQSWQLRTAQQPLRHRASYDGYSYHHQRFPQYGYPPSMSNGYTTPAKPAYHDPRSRRQLDAAAVWSRSQADAAAGQWYQVAGGGQYPPYVPRGHGHYRNRSVGGHGLNPPYRVLHSYNSPAYRNAPIWG
jgi:hypothetical protein